MAAVPAAACVSLSDNAALPGSLTRDDSGTRGAWYEDPTRAYGHDIMGEVQDAETLRAVVDGETCTVVEAAAGEGFVFEDIAPRLSDVDGDGIPEVIAVRSSFSLGGQLIIYRAEGAELVPLAATPHIGRRNRWLAPAAWGDLDGDGAWEVAYVDRPHLAKTLRVWRFGRSGLIEVATAAGVTNHRIGEPFISGGLRQCEDGPEIILASADWTRLLAARVTGGAVRLFDLGPWSRASAGRALSCG
ncbi:hypothetical protein JANAI61_13420 [Jannaschia sp. AI_61]|nr:hypothetical protein JANAI61_13420 [Jannaschia sp. AI_61]